MIDPNQKALQGRPEKASKPIEPAAAEGQEIEWTEGFSLHFFVAINPPSIHVRWNVSDPEAQETFFRANPMAASMLASLTRGPLKPPAAEE